MIYLRNFTCAFLFLAGRFQPQWLELSQELGKAEFGSTSANDVFWSGICHQLNYPDCMWLQKDNLAARAAQLSSHSGAGPGLMSWLPARLGRPWSKASQWFWKEPVQAHADLSPQAQQCPQAKRISFKAVPPGAQSQLWLWDVPKLICSLQSRSGTAPPSWFCRLTW